MKIFFLITAIWSDFYNSVIASQREDVGYYFLKLPANATQRALSMCYSTEIKGAKAIFCNPANVSTISNLSFSYNKHFLDTYSFSWAIVSKASGVNVGFGLFSVSSGEIPLREKPSDKPLTTYNIEDWAMIFNISKTFKTLSFGLNCKLVQQNLFWQKQGFYAFDLGIFYLLPEVKNFEIGFCVQNLVFYRIYPTAPVTVNLGFSYSYKTLKFICDFRKEVDEFLQICTALIFRPLNIFQIEISKRFFHDTENFSAGFEVFYSHFAISYALCHYRYGLAFSHILTIEAKF